ncbi:MAG: hypothetical protein EPN17_00630 [Methylobacter sp.]|nr:MAG: hypothetical protein EPN17_00630 [Methylobacter sp.]
MPDYNGANSSPTLAAKNNNRQSTRRAGFNLTKSMILDYKKTNLIFLALVAITVMPLVACTEKADSNQVESVVSTMTEDKVAKLQKEAQAGDPDAQYNLAYLYENGLGVPKNEVKALELYQQAADQGHSEAQNSLDAMSSSK